MANSLILELQELHKRVIEQADISLANQAEADDEWESGYAKGAEAAYADCAQQITEVLDFATELYPNS